MTTPECDHEIVFIGMVNINRDNYLQGVVDVWRCRKCHTLYCDDKRYGEPLKASVGFDVIPPDEQWGILTCTSAKEVAMNNQKRTLQVRKETLRLLSAGDLRGVGGGGQEGLPTYIFCSQFCSRFCYTHHRPVCRDGAGAR